MSPRIFQSLCMKRLYQILKKTTVSVLFHAAHLFHTPVVPPASTQTRLCLPPLCIHLSALIVFNTHPGETVAWRQSSLVPSPRSSPPSRCVELATAQPWVHACLSVARPSGDAAVMIAAVLASHLQSRCESLTERIHHINPKCNTDKATPGHT